MSASQLVVVPFAVGDHANHAGSTSNVNYDVTLPLGNGNAYRLIGQRIHLVKPSGDNWFVKLSVSVGGVFHELCDSSGGDQAELGDGLDNLAASTINRTYLKAPAQVYFSPGDTLRLNIGKTDTQTSSIVNASLLFLQER